MSESSDSDYDLYKKPGYNSDPEVFPSLGSKLTRKDPSPDSLTSEEAGPSHAKDHLKETRPLPFKVSFKDPEPSSVTTSPKDAGPGMLKHHGVVFKDIEVSQTSKDDREKVERKEISSKDDTVLSMGESSPDLKDFLTLPRSTARRSSTFSHDVYFKTLDPGYTSELFGSIVHHFRSSVTSSELSGPSKLASMSGSMTSQVSFSGQRKKTSLYTEFERRNSVKKSPRLSVLLDNEIESGKHVTYNDVKGRIWITVISSTLWALVFLAYGMRIYGMRHPRSES